MKIKFLSFILQFLQSKKATTIIDNCLSLKICIEKAVNPKTNCFVCMDIKLLLILNRYPNFNN